LLNYCNISLSKNNNHYYRDKFNTSLSISNFTFDISLAELIYPLYINKECVICNSENINNPEYISKLIHNYKVEYMVLTPSRFENYVINEKFLKSLVNLKTIKFGGEILNFKKIIELIPYDSISFYNEYGPSEATMHCSILPIDKENFINYSVGYPICNGEIYILDEYMKPVPVGVEGEIYIGGKGVGSGYLNREKLTNERFISNPFRGDPNDTYNKLYRTGDIGKWTNNGEVICLGRIDFQVKIHGHRIELGEIEEVMKSIKEIDTCVVIDKVRNQNDKYLVGYYIVNPEVDINKNKIRNYLKSKLPQYMIPNYFIEIPEIPTTINGKLDRRALPEPTENDLIINDYVEAETETEKKLVTLYSKILKIEENKIGKTSDFYELGGDSLIAIRLLAEIQKEFLIKIGMKDILKNETIELLGKYIDEKLKNNEDSIEIITRYGKNEYPIISQQLGLNTKDDIKSFNIGKIENNESNVIIFYEINNNIEIDKVIKILNKIYNRHDILKTRLYYIKENDEIEIYGKIEKSETLSIEQYTKENAHLFIRNYDLFKDQLIRIGIIENKILMIDINHIIGDGYSLGILCNEFNQLYNNEILDELPIQYTDYAIYYNEKLKNGKFNDQFEYYKEMFNNKILINNKIDSMKMKDEKITFEIDNSISNNINELIVKNKLSKEAFYYTLYLLIISKYVNNEDGTYSVLINSNRNNIYKKNLIGMFVNFIPILSKVNKEKSFIENVQNNFKVLMELYNLDISFYDISNKLGIPKPKNYFQFNPRLLTHSNVNNNNNESNILIPVTKENEKLLPFDALSNYRNNVTSIYDYGFLVNENEQSVSITISAPDKTIVDDMKEECIYILNNLDFLTKNLNEIENLFYFNKNLCEIKNLLNSNNQMNNNDKYYDKESLKINNKQNNTINNSDRYNDDESLKINIKSNEYNRSVNKITNEKLLKIRNIIKQMDNIEDVVLTKTMDENNNEIITCYYISSIIINDIDIKNYLENKISNNLIPQYIQRVDYIQYDKNGKVNEATLRKININENNIKVLDKKPKIMKKNEIKNHKNKNKNYYSCFPFHKKQNNNRCIIQ